MQLGIRLHDTRELPFEERIADVHRLGFAADIWRWQRLSGSFPLRMRPLRRGWPCTYEMCLQKIMWILQCWAVI